LVGASGDYVYLNALENIASSSSREFPLAGERPSKNRKKKKVEGKKRKKNGEGEGWWWGDVVGWRGGGK
jgi:hypothetical protein